MLYRERFKVTIYSPESVHKEIPALDSKDPFFPARGLPIRAQGHVG